MKSNYLQIPGCLVSLPLPGRNRPLDGFWSHGVRHHRELLLIVHGMGGNFYRSVFKKELMLRAGRHGLDVLSFNNRGYERDVAGERFTDCVADIAAAVDFGSAQGYRRIHLMGHSTGCQKITWYQARRRDRRIGKLVLAAIGDDLAIARRTLGRDYLQAVEQARRWLARGWKHKTMSARCLGFQPARFLSIADPRQAEARVFNFDGPLREFAGIRNPVLALFPEKEAFACIPVEEMARRLQRVTCSRAFASLIIPKADHSFHGAESEAADALLAWTAGR